MKTFEFDVEFKVNLMFLSGSVSTSLYNGDLYVYVVIGKYGDSVQGSCEEGEAAYAFIEIIPIDRVYLTDFPAAALQGDVFTDRPETLYSITISDPTVCNTYSTLLLNNSSRRVPIMDIMNFAIFREIRDLILPNCSKIFSN